MFILGQFWRLYQLSLMTKKHLSCILEPLIVSYFQPIQSCSQSFCTRFTRITVGQHLLFLYQISKNYRGAAFIIVFDGIKGSGVWEVGACSGPVPTALPVQGSLFQGRVAAGARRGRFLGLGGAQGLDRSSSAGRTHSAAGEAGQVPRLTSCSIRFSALF